MPKKKKTKAEKAAYAKAYAKRMTINKARDMYAAGGAIIDRVGRYIDEDDVTALKHISQDYAGVDIDTGEMVLGNLYRGYAGPLMNQAEREVYKFLGIRRPRSKVENIKDVIRYIAYDGAAGIAAWEKRDNLLESHRAFYKHHYGVNLSIGGLEAIQPEEMIWKKEIPYIFVNKIMQIPAIDKALKKLSFKFGG